MSIKSKIFYFKYRCLKPTDNVRCFKCSNCKKLENYIMLKFHREHELKNIRYKDYIKENY